jgi:tight adherence protein B
LSSPTRRLAALRWLLVVVVAAIASPAGAVGAQTSDGVELGRVDLDDFPEVQFDVSVAAGLTEGPVSADDIALTENGQAMPVTVLPVSTEGLEVVLLLDTSGSMNENNAIGSAKSAAASFLAELPPEVPVGVVAFADTPSLVSPLTTDRNALSGSIDRLRATGRTSLYDGIVFANSLFSGSTEDRQFVLLSDGGDTASAATLEEAIAITTEVRTNAIEIVTSESNSDALASLAEAGNGRLTSITDPAALGALYQEIARSLVDRYRVSFTSQASGSADYTLTVNTVFGPVSASRSVDLPEALTTTTAATATVPPSTAAAPDGTAPASATSAVAPPLSGQTDSDDSQNTSTIPLVIGAAAVGIALTILLLVLLTGDRRGVGRRQLGIDRLRKERGRSTSVGERISVLAEGAVDRSGRRTGLANALDVADIAMRPGEFVVVALSCAVTVGAVFWWLGGPLLGILGIPLTILGVRSYVSRRASRRRAAFEQQLPDVLQLITNALRSGFALPQALDAVAQQAAEPARSEFERVNFESRVGLDLGDSLQSLSVRMQSETFGWVVSALEINREVGGELAKVLAGLASTVRERQALDRQIRTLTAEGRLSSYVLLALPFLVGFAALLISPEYFEPMRESPGPQILIACGVLLAVGWVWMRAMIRTDF